MTGFSASEQEFPSGHRPTRRANGSVDKRTRNREELRQFPNGSELSRAEAVGKSSPSQSPSREVYLALAPTILGVGAHEESPARSAAHAKSDCNCGNKWILRKSLELTLSKTITRVCTFFFVKSRNGNPFRGLVLSRKYY